MAQPKTPPRGNGRNRRVKPEQIKLFVAALLRHDFCAAAAMRELGQKPRSALQRGYEMMQREDVQKAIADAVHKKSERLNITADEVTRRLNEFSLHGESETNRVRSTELLGKTLKMFTDKVDVGADASWSDLVLAAQRARTGIK